MIEVLLGFLGIENLEDSNLEEVTDSVFEDIETGTTYIVYDQESYAYDINLFIDEKIELAHDELHKISKYTDYRDFFFVDDFSLKEYYLDNQELLFEDSTVEQYLHNGKPYIIVIDGEN